MLLEKNQLHFAAAASHNHVIDYFHINSSLLCFIAYST